MGLFSGKRKKDEIKSVTGFVLLSKPQWDRYLFCADFQSDWGIDLDAGKVIGLEDEDVVKARLGSVNLTVTFMDFPLKNEELPIRTDISLCWPTGRASLKKSATRRCRAL